MQIDWKEVKRDPWPLIIIILFVVTSLAGLIVLGVTVMLGR